MYEFMKQLEVPGIKQEDIWQLFNVSYFSYYQLKVQQLRSGECGFCHIDLTINHPFDARNDSWHIWENTVSPQPGHIHQFVIPCRRHVMSLNELTDKEVVDLHHLTKWFCREFNITGGVQLVRDGDPAFNAKSMPHLHYNYHVPSGKMESKVTICKSEQDLLDKFAILLVFEKMRINLEKGWSQFEDLSPTEMELIAKKLVPPVSAAATK